MTRPALPVFLSPKAATQIERAKRWWSTHRRAAPGAIVADVERALRLIAVQPGCGVPATSKRIEGVRRLLLRRIGYFLYYRVNAQKHRVEVLALWHARREAEPPL